MVLNSPVRRATNKFVSRRILKRPLT
ncbi:hypothetical protein LINPERHAP2_LOCUS30486 [Linum perenne]